METWQKEYIQKNLPDLIKLTDFNSSVEAILLAFDLLADCDVETLKAIRSSSGRYEQASKSYEILNGRKHAYEKLTKALFVCKQSGAARLLLEGIKKQKITNPLAQCRITIPDEEFNNTEIIITGRSQTILDSYCSLDMTAVRKIFKETLSDIDYYDLIVKKEPFTLVNDTIPPFPPFYVSRFLSNKINITKDVFKEDCPDVFVFKGIERHELSQLVSPHLTASSESQFESLTTRFVYLAREEDWSNITKLAKVPVHLISCSLKKDTFFLENTSGDSDTILKFEGDEKRVYITENEFVNAQLAETHKACTVCICDTPGMGKTLFLANIARRFKAEKKNYATVFISLSKFFEGAKKLPEISENDEKTLFYLLEHICPTPESAKILQQLSKNGLIGLSLFFDGFDEIQLQEVEWVKKLIKTLMRNFIKAKVFITSRPHLRNELERSFRVISYDMLPFDEKTQTDFLVSFWSERMPNHSRVQIQNCASLCLTTIKETISTRDLAVTGIPLHCRLIADIYSDEALLYCRNYGPNFRFSSRTTCQMYIQYVRKRIENVVKTQQEIDNYIKLHAWYAMKLIFPQNEVLIDVFHFKDEIDVILKIGIMQQRDQKNCQEVEFIHRTFAEYLIAEYFANFLSLQKHLPEESFKFDFFVKNLLDIRPFCERKNNVIAYFLDSFIGQNMISKESTKRVADVFGCMPPERIYSLLLESCIKQLIHTFKFLVNVLKNCENEQILREFTKDRLYYILALTIQNTGFNQLLLDCLQLITEIFKFNLNDILPQNFQPEPWVEMAAGLGNYEAFEYFIDKCPHSAQNVLRSCICYSHDKYPAIVQNKVHILKFLLSKYSDLISLAPDILFWRLIHVKLMIALIKFGADTTRSENGENFLCYSLRRGYKYKPADFHDLVEFLLSECKAEHLFRPSKLNDVRFINPMQLIIKNVEILPKTVRLLLGIHGTDINKIPGENLLFTAVTWRHFDTVRELINFGANPKIRGSQNQSLLHVAARKNSRDMITNLLSLDLDINCCDENGNTPIHCTYDLSLIKFLVELGADVTASNNKGQNILHKAAKAGNLDLIRYLVNIGMGLNLRDNDRNNSFLLCSSEKAFKCCAELGANVKAKNGFGQNALHMLAIYGWYSKENDFKYLVSLGLNINERDMYGNTPLCYVNSSRVRSFNLTLSNLQ